MVWIPDGEKLLKIRLFILTQFTIVTDGQTDRQTLYDGISRSCIASCGKNYKPSKTESYDRQESTS